MNVTGRRLKHYLCSDIEKEIEEDGRVQLYEHNGRKGMLAFTSYETARKYVNRRLPTKLSVAKIGTVAGETLDVQFEASKQFGATGVWLTDGERTQWITKAN